ncbi:MAG: class I SAM-dependent methyltransferase [Planctomycetes bacterium]|nr:class I SAM-dependent methyltransferase [Planctomycetota bacterium]
MRLDTLRDIACPADREGRPCRAGLVPDGSHPVLRPRAPAPCASAPRAPADGDEILEALLACTGCGTRYPVLLGVPVLVEPLGPYLRTHYYQMEEAQQAHGEFDARTRRFLTERMLDTMERPHGDLFKRPGITHVDRDPQYISAGIEFHYRPPPTEAYPPGSVAAHLTGIPDSPQGEAMAYLARSGRPAGGRALEVGCHVGGFVHDLARRSSFVYGVDLCFRTALVARQIAKGVPCPKGTYSAYEVSDVSVERPFRADTRRNADFLVASGARLPFGDGFFSTVACFHVSEVADDGLALLDDMARVLQPGGLQVLASIDGFRDFARMQGGNGAGPSPHGALKDRLQRTCRLLEEKDNIPWIRRNSRRSFMVHMSHCLWGEKRGAP